MKELQELVARAVEQRGYRQGWTDEQYAARQVCKAIEELGELLQATKWQQARLGNFWPVWAHYLSEAALVARRAFDDSAAWGAIEEVDVSVAADELADVVIPLLVFADTLGIDLGEAIKAKALGDIARGVRGESPEPQERGCTWTTEPPAVEGFYWWRARAEDDAEIVRIKRLGNGVLSARFTSGGHMSFANAWGEWRPEPIRLPEEGARVEPQEQQEQWVPLSELRAGAIFETQDGQRGLKTPDVSANGVWAHCVTLKDGKKFYPKVTTLVREIVL